MIKFFSAVFLLLPSFCLCQEPAENAFPMADRKIYYEKIITADSVTKAEIYNRVKLWSVNAFVSQKHTTQNDDKEGGIIVYKFSKKQNFDAPKYMVRLPITFTWDCTLAIYMKDGKTKVVLNNVELKQIGLILYELQITPENYRKEFEPRLIKAMYGEKYRTKYFNTIHDEFVKTDIAFKKLILDITDAINKQNKKSDFDF